MTWQAKAATKPRPMAAPALPTKNNSRTASHRECGDSLQLCLAHDPKQELPRVSALGSDAARIFLQHKEHVGRAQVDVEPRLRA